MSRVPRVGLLVASWVVLGGVLYWGQYSYTWFVVEPRILQERLLGWSLPAFRLLKHRRSFAYDSSGSDEWEFNLNTEELAWLRRKCLNSEAGEVGMTRDLAGHELPCYLAENTDVSTKITESVQISNGRLRVVRLVD